MKKVLCFLISLALLFTCSAMPAFAQSSTVLNISDKDITHQISSNLYGISLEDISYSCDGGLVSNLVCNGSFEYDSKPEAAWQFNNVEAVLSNSDSMNENNPSYEMLTVNGKGTIKNLGFTEIYNYKTYDYDEDKALSADMGFEEGVSYDFSCYIKNVDFEGTIGVYLDSKNNSSNIVQLNTSSAGTQQWSKLSAVLKASATEDGGLAIMLEGSGSILIDFVSLIPENSYGYGKQEWKYTTLRPDLVEALKNLNPSFIRFPGGCFAEGDSLDNLYSWKDTIGSLENRPQTHNVWADNDNGNYYNNTNSMGYHEYFQLCEDLNAKAVPVVNAGLTCQSKNGYEDYISALNKISMSDEQWIAYLVSEKGFEEKDKNTINEYTSYIESLKINSQQDFDNWLDTVALKPGTDDFNNYVQDILDLIEYANGDAQTTYWGALRAANGHSEPFDLEYISIGNENFGEVYLRNFEAVYDAVKKKYPDIKVVCSAGNQIEGNAFDNAWDIINDKYTDALTDEHLYLDNDYFLSHGNRYDSYDRDGAGVFVGGYASSNKGIGSMITNNNIWSAVGEAAFMTGFERNSDIVKMTSYAPVLAKINANSSNVNLIWFDSQNMVLTPDYFVQMLYSNNVGSEYIDSKITSDSDASDVFQSVSVDKDKQIIYVKLVNSGSKKNITINIDGFDDINYISNQNMSSGYKSASNELDKIRIAPCDDEIEVNGSSFDVTLKQNSINVIRIAYGENEGDALYQLPEGIDYDTKSYIPVAAKIIIACAVLAVGVGSVIGFVLYTKVISKKKKD